MKRLLIGIIVGVILFAWSGVGMADLPANVQALIDKGASGQQLTVAPSFP